MDEMGNIKDEETCDTCAYWCGCLTGDIEGDPEARCQRHAPSPRVDTVGETERLHDGSISVVWPLTYHDSWCGEYKRVSGI